VLGMIVCSPVRAQVTASTDDAGVHTAALAPKSGVVVGEPTAKSAVKESEPAEDIRLIVRDGQLRSHTLEVFATTSIPRSRHPRLQLRTAHAVTTKDPGEDTWFVPVAVATNQTRTITLAGVDQAATGTLILFDVSKYPVNGLKPMTRLRPVLAWDDEGVPPCDPKAAGNTCRVLIGDEEVNLGNPIAAYAWSAFVLLSLLLALLIVCRASVIDLLRGKDGRLSLSRFQAAAWTLAIGWVVMSFGFMLRASPDLPWQVAVLMGLSLTTATVSYRKEVVSSHPDSVRQSLTDLIVGEGGQVSLARVQMLVWTVISLVLFVSKSILQGVVWAVPEELVALMGLSQAGYLLPKWLRQGNATDVDGKASAPAGAAK